MKSLKYTELLYELVENKKYIAYEEIKNLRNAMLAAYNSKNGRTIFPTKNNAHELAVSIRFDLEKLGSEDGRPTTENIERLFLKTDDEASSHGFKGFHNYKSAKPLDAFYRYAYEGAQPGDARLQWLKRHREEFDLWYPPSLLLKIFGEPIDIQADAAGPIPVAPQIVPTKTNFSHPPGSSRLRGFFVPVLVGFAAILGWLMGLRSVANPKITQKVNICSTWYGERSSICEHINEYAMQLEKDLLRLPISVFHGSVLPDSKGKAVSSNELYDAVKSNKIQMLHCSPYYFLGQNGGRGHRLMPLFNTLPFGRDPHEMQAWLHENQDTIRHLLLHDSILLFPAGSTGPQGGGWFRRDFYQQIRKNGYSAFKGKMVRFAGLAGKILADSAGTVPHTQTKPPYLMDTYADILDGKLVAFEYIDLVEDAFNGFFLQNWVYDTLTWHEPEVINYFMVNRTFYEQLSPNEQRLLSEGIGNYFNCKNDFPNCNTAASIRERRNKYRDALTQPGPNQIQTGAMPIEVYQQLHRQTQHYLQQEYGDWYARYSRQCKNCQAGGWKNIGSILK